MVQDKEEEVATWLAKQEHEPMVANLIEPAIINLVVIDTTNTLAVELEEDEDLLADPGDLDKAISISFIVDDKGKGPSCSFRIRYSELPSQRVSCYLGNTFLICRSKYFYSLGSLGSRTP